MTSPEKKINVNIGQTILSYDKQRREFNDELANTAIEYAYKTEGRTVIVGGLANNYVRCKLPGKYDTEISYRSLTFLRLPDKDVIFVYALTDLEYIKYRNDGYKIYYLPGVEYGNIEAAGTDLRDYGAEELFSIDDM